MKKVFKWIGTAFLFLVLIAGSLYMIYLRPFIQKMKVVNDINYDKELTIVIGGGGNSGVIASDSLVVVVDTKMDEAALNLYEKAKKIARNKPILVINTHVHPDHIGGNKLYKGCNIIAGGNYSREHWIKQGGEESLPNQWLKGIRRIHVGDDTLTILNLEQNAHTESDLVVYLHRRKLLFGGDVILNRQNAIIMDKGTANGYLWAFDRLMLAFDIQQVVPGHGQFGGKEVIDNFQTYFKDLKLASEDDSQKSAMIAKYKDWNSIPVFMSPEAIVRAFKKEK